MRPSSRPARGAGGGRRGRGCRPRRRRRRRLPAGGAGGEGARTCSDSGCAPVRAVALARRLERELADGLQRRRVQLLARRADHLRVGQLRRRRRSSARDSIGRALGGVPSGRLASTNFVTAVASAPPAPARVPARLRERARRERRAAREQSHQRARDQLPPLRLRSGHLGLRAVLQPKPCQRASRETTEVPAARSSRRPPRTSVRPDTRQLSVRAGAEAEFLVDGWRHGRCNASLDDEHDGDAADRTGAGRSRISKRFPADAKRALVQARPGVGAVRHQPALRCDGRRGEAGAAVAAGGHRAGDRPGRRQQLAVPSAGRALDRCRAQSFLPRSPARAR